MPERCAVLDVLALLVLLAYGLRDYRVRDFGATLFVVLLR